MRILDFFYENYVRKIIDFCEELEGKCDKESLKQLQIIGWNEETKKFISDVLNLYKEKVVKELNELSSISNKSEKKEENNMENYIVINGQKLELTEEQLKQLGIEVEKKRNNPFNNEINKYEDMPYYMIDHTDIESGVVTEYSDGSDFEKTAVIRANSFNDKDFANQIYLHELLNRKLLKYAYDNQAGYCEWGDDYNRRYYIYFDYHFNKFMVSPTTIFKELCVYFSSEKIAKQAIKDVIEPFIETHKEFVW